MEYFGYLAAIVMGMVLGAIGGGGSILTVPILVYMFGQDASLATGYSLLIVGLTATYGAIGYYRQGLIEVKASLIFAVPSIIAVYLTRAYLMPAIPEVIVSSPFLLERSSDHGELCIINAVICLYDAHKKYFTIATAKQTSQPALYRSRRDGGWCGHRYVRSRRGFSYYTGTCFVDGNGNEKGGGSLVTYYFFKIVNRVYRGSASWRIT